MMISICADVQGRVTGVCPDNLTGGPGWSQIETGLTPRAELFSAHGVPLYKLADGVVVPRTPEEVAADAPEPEPDEVSEAERLDQIEAGLMELAAIIAGGE